MRRLVLAVARVAGISGEACQREGRTGGNGEVALAALFVVA